MAVSENRRRPPSLPAIGVTHPLPSGGAPPRPPVVCELRQWVLVQVDPRQTGTQPAPQSEAAPGRLTLAAGPLSREATLVLDVQSISPSGLAVFSAPCAPNQIDAGVLSDPPEGETLTFVLERDGQSMTLQASLVWVELSSEQRLELIVDTGDQPGWLEVQSTPAAG